MIDPARLALAEDLDRRIVTHHRALASARRELALSLAEIEDTRLFRELGFSTLGAYVKARLTSLKPKTSMALARLGHSLKTLPKLDAALAAGEIEWTKARDVAPILTPETEDVWVPHLAEVSSQRLAAELQVVKRGDPPPAGDLDDLAPARETMKLTFEASDAEIVRQAVGLARAQCGLSASELDTAQVVAILARAYVADPAHLPPSTGAAAAADGVKAPNEPASPTSDDQERDRPPTSEPYRIVLERCPDCRRMTSPEHEVSDTVADEAACDAEVVDMTDGPTRGHRRRTIPPSTRTIVLHRYRWRCAVPHCTCRLWLDVHHLVEVAAGGTNDVDNLVPLCPFHHRLCTRACSRWSGSRTAPSSSSTPTGGGTRDTRPSLGTAPRGAIGPSVGRRSPPPRRRTRWARSRARGGDGRSYARRRGARWWRDRSLGAWRIIVDRFQGRR